MAISEQDRMATSLKEKISGKTITNVFWNNTTKSLQMVLSAGGTGRDIMGVGLEKMDGADGGTYECVVVRLDKEMVFHD